MRALLLLAMLAACAGSPPTDKFVTSKFIGTKPSTNSMVIGGRVGVITTEVAAYYLVSRDNMVCEVESREYATSAVGHLASCEWGEP